MSKKVILTYMEYQPGKHGHYTIFMFVDLSLHATFDFRGIEGKPITMTLVGAMTDHISALTLLVKFGAPYVSQLVGAGWKAHTANGKLIYVKSAENLMKNYVCTLPALSNKDAKRIANDTFEAAPQYAFPHDHVLVSDTPTPPPPPTPKQQCAEELDAERYAHHSGVMQPTTPELARAIVDEVMHRMQGEQPA